MKRPRPRLTDEDRERIVELRDEMAGIMRKYNVSGVGPYDPVGHAAWRIGDAVKRFLATMEKAGG